MKPSRQNRPARSELAKVLESARRSFGRSGRVNRRLPNGGRLFFDRPAPFLCLYRKPPAEPPGDATLPTTQAAFLIAGRQASQARDACQLVAAEMSRRFGAFLLLELWPAKPDSPRRIRVHAPAARMDDPVLVAAREALSSLRAGNARLDVTVVASEGAAPPRLAPALDAQQLEQLNALLIGVEYPAVYRSSDGSVLHPEELRRFRRRLGAALQKTFFAFAGTRNPKFATSYDSLAHRGLRQAARYVDQRLSAVSSSFDFLFHVTPVDIEERWQEFQSGRYAKAPGFSYRPLPFEPRELKRLLFAAPLDRVEDPLLWELFAQKQDELDRQISLLADRGSPRFRHGAIALYGAVDDGLLELARAILAGAAPKPSKAKRKAHCLSAHDVAARAWQEIAWYQERDAKFDAGVEIRDDIAAAMMVSRNRLMIASSVRIRPERITALLHHEIGTHLITWFNGSMQRLRLLRDGAAGYEPAQEGLAVLSEYVSGGLTLSRLRTLAARVEAVQCMIGGASFVETFEHLRQTRGLDPHGAFRLTARVFRGGGFSKDAAYLRGLRDLLAALEKGVEIDLFFTGKVSLRNVALLRTLQRREIVRPPALRPRWAGSSETLEKLQTGAKVTVLDLLAEVKNETGIPCE